MTDGRQKIRFKKTYLVLILKNIHSFVVILIGNQTIDCVLLVQEIYATKSNSIHGKSRVVGRQRRKKITKMKIIIRRMMLSTSTTTNINNLIVVVATTVLLLFGTVVVTAFTTTTSTTTTTIATRNIINNIRIPSFQEIQSQQYFCYFFVCFVLYLY